MIRDLGIVQPGMLLRIPFHTFDSNDPSASVTITGLATSDIEIYKDGSVTQRASDAGYALLDTDGIDFDAITGIHGISVDLADNTTAGFYAAGSQYWIVISSVTVDAATINFVLATFRIGQPGAVLNTTIATLASQTSFTLTEGPAEDDALNGCVVRIHDVASAIQAGFAVVQDYTGSTKTVTLTAGTTFTAAATDNISVFAPSNAQWGGTVAYTATRGLAGTALPAAAANAAGGLLISAAGSFNVDTQLGTDIDAILADTNEVQVSLAAGGLIESMVDDLQTEVDGIQADTEDIQARLPAALTAGGNMKSDALAISGDTGAADALETAYDGTAGPVPEHGILDQGTAQSAAAANVVIRAAAAFGDNTLVGATAMVLGSTQGYWQSSVVISNTLADDTLVVRPWGVTPSGTITYKIFASAAAAQEFFDAIEDAVWDAATADHAVAGSTGEALEAAGTAGDPWTTALPGAYGAGSAGNILGNRLVGTIATGTHNPQSGDAFARLGAPAGASVSADILAIDNLVDDLESRVGTPSNLGSGATLAANNVDIESQTDDIGAAGAGLTALATAAELAKVPKSDGTASWNATAAAQIQSEANDALVAYDPPTHTELTSGLAAADDATLSAIAAVDAKIGTPSNLGSGATLAANNADIESQTDDIGVAGAGLTAAGITAAGVRTAVGLASANLDTQLDALPTAVENADALLGRTISGGANGGRSVTSALRVIRNKKAISAGTLTVYAEDDTTPDHTAAVSTAAGDPVSAVDPV